MTTYQDQVNNPLPSCPETPNCARASELFDINASDLFATAQRALKGLEPEEVREVAPFRMTSVHRVWFFLDDMDFVVTEHGDGSALHVRSASREGQWDLGVNGRRVRRFVRAVKHLVARQGQPRSQRR